MTDYKDAGPGERSVYDRTGMPHVFPSECVVPLMSPDGQMLGSAMGFSRGLTLRDYFAGQALAGAMSTLGEVTSIRLGDVAQDCYTAADHMLEARK